MTSIVEPLLGTRGEFDIDANSPEASAMAETAILDEVARLERVFSVFDEQSALWDFRRTGTTTAPELQTVMDLAQNWQRRTGGAYDPGVARQTELWDQAEEAGEVPSAADLASVIRTPTGATTSVAIDLNAIAKGWIADEAVGAAHATPGVTSVWLSLGGDVVHRGSGGVVVGIEDPHRPYDNVAPLTTIEVSNESLATSGASRRWWSIDGERYSKVIDPRTSQPANQLASATVVAPDGATADLLATVAIVVSTAEIVQLANDVGAECFLVHHDRSTTTTGRFTPS